MREIDREERLVERDGEIVRKTERVRRRREVRRVEVEGLLLFRVLVSISEGDRREGVNRCTGEREMTARER